MWKMMLLAFMAGLVSVDACDKPSMGVYSRNRTTRTDSIQSNFLPRQKEGESKVSYVKRVAKFVEAFKKKTLGVCFFGGRTPNGADTSNIKHILFAHVIWTL